MFAESTLTEDQWLSTQTIDDAAWMIRRYWMDTESPSARKSQLVACACARLAWHHLSDRRSRHGVEVAERFVDRRASLREINTAADASYDAYESSEVNSPAYWASVAAGVAARSLVDRFSDWKAINALAVLCRSNLLPLRKGTVAEYVRDILGNPFRPVTLDASWKTSTVIALAQAIYHEGSLPAGTFKSAHLAVLSDALEDAGCDNANILDHCREPGSHVRGCWVLDLLLGYE